MKRLIISILIGFIMVLTLSPAELGERPTPEVIIIMPGQVNPNPYHQLYEDLLYPTVRITSESGVGSGVVISHRRDVHPPEAGKKDAKNTIYILTACHVVDTQNVVNVELYDSRVITASVVITDTLKDLALLRTQIGADFKDKLYTAKLAPKNYVPYLFTPVYTIGCSLGLPPRPSNGIISYISDNLRSSASHWEISAPILPGNSGGPVYDGRTYEVIGIAVWVKVYGGQLITTMAGIVPISEIHDFLNKAQKLKGLKAQKEITFELLNLSAFELSWWARSEGLSAQQARPLSINPVGKEEG